MADGLLGSFDNVMAGLTADDIESLADPVVTDAADGEPGGPEVDGAPESTHETAAAPHRVVDPRAQAVADRLLRRGLPGAPTAVADASTARLILIVEQPDRNQEAGVDGAATVIDDGDTVVIGRGDAASHDEPLLLRVSYGVVSRQHCRVTRRAADVSIVDAGSANGTVLVRHGEVLTVGGQPVSMVHGDVVATAGGHRPFLRFEFDPQANREQPHERVTP